MADTASQTETVTINVDGKPMPAKPGEMVIAAAERGGVYIPRFCYHPRLRPVGMCRMCLVEVKGPRGFALAPACFIPVADGQEVITASDKVKKAQDGVLEFLLVNHPLDCPVCDKGGECPLQDQTLAYGPGETRFVEEKRHWAKPIALSDLVSLDRERCIQCDRCTRFADEVAGDPLIEFKGRGDHIEVATFPDQPFASYFSGNTVQICPVGALLSKPYRFKARPWDLEQVESTCTMCSVGCRIAVQSSGPELTRYIGLDSDPVNHGWLCDKGRYSYSYVNSPERLSRPLVRKNDELVEASWGEALEAAARGLEGARSVHGAASLAVLGGARLANEDAYVWAKLAKGVLGTDNVDAQLGDGLPADVVLGLPRATIDDACSAPAVILLAPDLKEELPVLYLRLRAAALEAGVPFVELTPRRTGMSRHCKASLTYRPGEAAALARALVEGSPTEVAGVPAGSIAAAAELLRVEGAVVVLGRPSLAEPAESVTAAAAILAAGLPGCRFLPALRRANVMGALDMGLAPGVLPGRVALDAGREWFAEAWGGVPEGRGLDATGILAATAEGRIQGLVLLGADPLSDHPDRHLARAALSAAGFVVAVDTFLTASSGQADVVLPAAAFAERPGTTTNLEGRITRLGQKIVPPGVAWPDWMIAAELAFHLEADLGVESIEDIWSEVERLAPSHRGISPSLLADRRHRDGVVAPLAADVPSDLAPPPEAATASGAGATTAAVPAGVDPMSTPGVDAVETQGLPATDVAQAGTAPSGGIDPGVEGDEAAEAAQAPLSTPPPTLAWPADQAQPPLPPLDGYSLRLVTGRTLYDSGTLAQRTPALAPLAPAPTLRANPYDLERLGRGQGGQVRVRSNRGTFLAEAVPDNGVPRGSVWLPFDSGAGEVSAGEVIEAGVPVTDLRVETP
ncbi:MAG TPA: NADH-quinone oxidoreductase subunit NuoG [Acidimicrobiales bacterium]|nr:NADH-quinone oxidoreductase subunit NuoG [Acidimicrobiales bacterium]